VARTFVYGNSSNNGNFAATGVSRGGVAG